MFVEHNVTAKSLSHFKMKTPISVVLFFNCALLLSCVWQLFRLYRHRGKRNRAFYVQGITVLIGLPLGVGSFFHQECHAYCAIIFGLLLFTDTYKEQKGKPVSKWSSAYASVISGYGFGIVCIIYGLIRIYDIFTGCYQ